MNDCFLSDLQICIVIFNQDLFYQIEINKNYYFFFVSNTFFFKLTVVYKHAMTAPANSKLLKCCPKI